MNTKEKIQRHAFTMRVDDDFGDKVDRLRKLISPTPSKSDAVRMAVDIAIATLSKGKR